MPDLIQLNFPHTINVSVQPTDIVYTCLIVAGQAGVNHPNANVDTKPFAIGVVTDVDHGGNSITIDRDDYQDIWYPNGINTLPMFELTLNHYLFFSKDRRTNMSGILGYYSLTEYRNYTSKKAEIFATTADFSSSSK